MKIIDTNMHGRPGLTGAFLIEAERPALIESGPKSSVDAVLAGLSEAGVDSLDWIIVTHIHLDHAGAAGTLAARFPDARIGVHEVGARHLVDPSKLWSSASRIYGDAMERLWGGIDPIPEERITSLSDGDQIDLGSATLTAFDTPGHAGHHHVFLDDATGTAFTGDALGVRLPDIGLVRPATPPPEFDIELAISSIERIRSIAPSSLCLTHFGPSHQGEGALGVSDTCDAAIEALRTWEGYVREAREHTTDLAEVTEHVRTSVESQANASLTEEAVARLEQTTSYEMNTWGYMRYLDRLEAH